MEDFAVEMMPREITNVVCLFVLLNWTKHKLRTV